jgi:hypothetical protein
MNTFGRSPQAFATKQNSTHNFYQNPYIGTRARAIELNVLTAETVRDIAFLSGIGVCIASPFIGCPTVAVIGFVAEKVAEKQRAALEQELAKEAANNREKQRSAALEKREHEKREKRAKEFGRELDKIGSRIKKDYDSGRFMKEYRDPPMPGRRSA